MAHIVLSVGSSHGPTIQSPPEHLAVLASGDTRDPRFDYQALVDRARPGLEQEVNLDVQRQKHAAAHAALRTLTAMVRDAQLDVLIVVSNTHRVQPTGDHPVFGIYRGATFPAEQRSTKPFDPDRRFLPESRIPKAKDTVDKPAHAALANHLIDFLIADGYDIACADRLPDGVPLDDAFTFAYEWLLDGVSLPLLPFMLSRDLPNQATPKRCHELGKALRRAVEAWPIDARVGLFASGGLSHQIVDEELDREVIAALTGNEVESLYSLPRERLNGAPGTPEILNWIMVAGAMAPARMTLLDYLPVYRSLAGTGHGLTFGYWR